MLGKQNLVSETKLERKTIWLGHNLKNRFLLRGSEDLARISLILSAGDLVDRPRLEPKLIDLVNRETAAGRDCMIDSGGFKALTKENAILSTEALARIYESANAAAYVSLDVPPVPGDCTAIRQKKWHKTIYNLARLAETGIADRLVPVVHGFHLNEIETNCEAVRKIMPNPGMIGLGGRVPLLRGMKRAHDAMIRPDHNHSSKSARFAVYTYLHKTFALMRGYFPKSRIHLFGAGSPRMALMAILCGAESVDSISWRKAANFGCIFLPGCGERIPSLEPTGRTSRPYLSQHDLELLAECACPICRDETEVGNRASSLSGDYRKRAVHNAWQITNEFDEISQINTIEKLENFVRCRFGDRYWAWVLDIGASGWCERQIT